jgi:7,8-dihydropterin-6-yl-methyl-4-(beta-D-ribofuranosyl)aminobenzene 5'-phosphate synthase
MKTIIVCFGLILSLPLSAQQIKIENLTTQEEKNVYSAIENDSVFASRIENTSSAINLYQQFKFNVLKSDSIWESDQTRLKIIEDVGYTNKFELIPLVEDLYGNADFKNAIGVSYLIRTDHSTIIFDTGIDDDSTMCVFRYNLNKLGIDISEIDAIFISHNHGDHQNNWKWINDKTFVNSENVNILPGIKIYVPDDNLDLEVPVIFSYDPIKISEGVYSTGVINAPMFFSSILEQGLLFNVKDKGIILISGCGHQTVEKILQRYDKISDVPLYGILGGLHLPIDNDSERYMSFYISGKLPWQPFTISDVNNKIELIKRSKPKLVGLSTHDSSPKAVEAFKSAFVTEYQDLKTGEWIVVE